MMRICPSGRVAWALLLLLGGAAPPPNSSTPPAYPLTKEKGPWLVVVKSFQGPQAIELANQLARELRQDHRITTYTFTKRPEQADGPQQAGLERGRVRQYESVAVLAGDFKDEKEATKVRDKIRKIRPKCITREMTSKYLWEVGPLSTAFLVPNPLAPKPQAEKPKADSGLLKFNTGRYNIFTCPGELSLKVYEFRGAVAFTDEQHKKLEENIKKGESLLNAGGEYAERIADQLRRQGVEAYTYHGHYSSVVCVGHFADPQDPQIEQLAKQLAGMKVAGFELSPSPVAVPVPKK